MFVRFADDSVVQDSDTIAPAWVDELDDALFVFDFCENAFAAFLNISVFLSLWFNTKKEFQACFYIIMRTFTLFTGLNAIGTLATLIYRRNPDFEECSWVQFILLVNMFTLFSSSLWLFYAGLNRMMVLVYPNIFIKPFQRWIVRATLTFMSLFAIIVTVLYQRFCGMYSTYDAKTNSIQLVQNETGMAEPIIIFVYAFPLTSLVFYAKAYNNLKGKRGLVVSDKAKQMIDRAERRTLKCGFVILISYTIALAAHIFLLIMSKKTSYICIMNRFDEIVSGVPQVVLPSSLFICNAKVSWVNYKKSLRKARGMVSDSHSQESIDKTKTCSQKTLETTADLNKITIRSDSF